MNTSFKIIRFFSEPIGGFKYAFHLESKNINAGTPSWFFDQHHCEKTIKIYKQFIFSTVEIRGKRKINVVRELQPVYQNIINWITSV